MIIEAFKAKDDSFHWIDVVDPTGSEFEILSQQYGLPTSSIQDCLDPTHLPKYEILGNHVFIMLRALDEQASSNANTLRELTQKIAIFMDEHHIITLHRRDHPFIKTIREKWVNSQEFQSQSSTAYMPLLLSRIVQTSFQSFNRAISQAENKLEDFEILLANDKSTSASIQEKFILKSQAYVYKRILRLSEDILPKLKIISEYNPLLYQEIKESLDASYFHTENILEHVNNLINLHLSLASHHTNEIVRILTLFSGFFLPLMFIVGFYGMNLKMPEFNYDYSYPIIVSFMIIVCVVLYLWFRRKEWL